MLVLGDPEKIQISKLLGVIMHELVTQLKEIEIFNLERRWFKGVTVFKYNEGLASRRGLELVC